MRLMDRRRAATAVGVLMAGCVGIIALHSAGTDDAQAGPRYRSVAQMADLVGCAQTLRPVPLVGPAWDAGDCTTPDGIRVQLRMFDNEDQAIGWGSAMRETDTGPSDPAAYGDGWVVRAIDADRDQVNRIFSHVT